MYPAAGVASKQDYGSLAMQALVGRPIKGAGEGRGTHLGAFAEAAGELRKTQWLTAQGTAAHGVAAAVFIAAPTFCAAGQGKAALRGKIVAKVHASQRVQFAGG